MTGDIAGNIDLLSAIYIPENADESIRTAFVDVNTK